MTGSMWGADVEALRHLAQELVRASGELDGLSRHLTGQLAKTLWEGPDADGFRGDWTFRHVPALLEISNALAGTGKRLLDNATQQHEASAVAGTGATTPPPGGPPPTLPPGITLPPPVTVPAGVTLDDINPDGTWSISSTTDDGTMTLGGWLDPDGDGVWHATIMGPDGVITVVGLPNTSSATGSDVPAGIPLSAINPDGSWSISSTNPDGTMTLGGTLDPDHDGVWQATVATPDGVMIISGEQVEVTFGTVDGEA